MLVLLEYNFINLINLGTRMHFTIVFLFLKTCVIMSKVIKLVILLLITSHIRYCAKTPELKNCVFTVLEAIKPCISEKIRSDFDDVKNSTSQLLDFICYKDGERVTC